MINLNCRKACCVLTVGSIKAYNSINNYGTINGIEKREKQKSFSLSEDGQEVCMYVFIAVYVRKKILG